MTADFEGWMELPATARVLPCAYILHFLASLTPSLTAFRQDLR